MLVDYAPNTTYEGDNTVLYQQSARLITKTWKKLYLKEEGEKATGLLSYLNEVDSLLSSKSSIKSVEDALNLDNLEKGLAVRAAFRIKSTMEQMAQKDKEGVSETEKVNSLLAVDIVKMAQNHIMYVAFKIFRNTIDTPGFIKCPNLRGHMLNLAKIYAITELVNVDSSANYETGFFSLGSSGLLTEAAKKLMFIMRPHMISLVESFQFPDSVLCSAIGNSYGDIYE